MEYITRNVRDISTDELRLYETVLGEKLKENQQVISLVASNQNPESPPEKQGDQAATGVAFPDWCNVYEGLSDEEISDVETVVLDRSGWTHDPIPAAIPT